MRDVSTHCSAPRRPVNAPTWGVAWPHIKRILPDTVLNSSGNSHCAISRESAMLNPKVLDEIGNKVSELIAASPAKDLEKNARALMLSMFARLDLVTREEFDVQKELLARTRAKLEALEARVAELEARLAGSRDPGERDA